MVQECAEAVQEYAEAVQDYNEVDTQGVVYRIPNIEYYSVLRKSEYQIPNTIRYQENPNTEYE